jgi:hypothetical protein
MVESAGSNLVDVTSSDVIKLTYFFDEQLGHYLWHIGVLGLAALLICHEVRLPAGLQTVWMGLPFAILVTIFGLIWGARSWGSSPCWLTSSGFAW